VSNDFYSRTSNPAFGSKLLSTQFRNEHALIEAAFDKLPAMTGKAGYYVAVNGAGTALEAVLAPTGTLPTQTGNAGKVLFTTGTSAYWGLLYSDWATKSSAYTAAAGDRLRCNTSGGAFTVTLPASPADGAQIWFMDYSGTFDSYAVTFDGNGKTVLGDTTFVADIKHLSGALVYISASGNWGYA
jgi:hypothetical protein